MSPLEFFRDLSIRRKLTLIMMLTATAAVILISLAFLTFELLRFRTAVRGNLSTLAEIVGNNSTAALTFKDPKSAHETLQALAAEKHVVSAHIYTLEGNLFASYVRGRGDSFAPPPAHSFGHRFTKDFFELFQPITLHDEKVGTIFLRYSLEEMNSRLRQYAGIVALVMILSLFVAFFLSSLLQKLVSGPILHLVQTAKAVSRDKDYSVRAIATSRDELGALINGFNEMLEQIQQRDDALQKAYDDLEEKVERRTWRLQQEIAERKRAAAELEKALRIKGEFLSIMSHELRTPLNIIMGYTKILLDRIFGALNEDQERGLGKISRCSNELLSMINDIMEATRIEADKVTIEWEEVCPAEILDDLKGLYQVQRNAGTALEWHYPPDLPVLISDRAKLKQVLQNLLNNALKFTDTGTITVSARPVGQSRAVEFKVTDTGIGIAEDKLPLIFDMFRQVDSSASRSHGGVGLGLYIVKKFTEHLGGTVNVESEMGKGSTFTVIIPADRSNGTIARTEF